MTSHHHHHHPQQQKGSSTDFGVTQSKTHLAWLGVFTDGGFVRRGQLWGIVVHVQDADAHRSVGRHGVIIYEKR